MSKSDDKPPKTVQKPPITPSDAGTGTTPHTPAMPAPKKPVTTGTEKKGKDEPRSTEK